jgi:hypothetical protein
MGSAASEPRHRKDRMMDLLALVMILTFGLIIFGILAATVGSDSRDSIGDDWSGASRI